MKTSSAGRAAIIRHEGVRLAAYPDPATKGEPFTIGVGHTSAAGPPKVSKGMKITRAQADEILSRDLATFEKAVNSAVKVPLNQNEFDALVSFTFNVGATNFKKSSVLRKLNAGDRAGAANAFLLWNKAAGKVMKGLTKRRKEERALFLKPGKAAEPKPAPKPADTPITAMAMSLGDKGPVVAELKRDLNILEMGPLVEDDNYDAATKKAVEAFQATHKDEGGKPLKVDGIAGPRTTKSIAAAKLAPKLEEAKKNIPPTADKAVKEESGLLKKIGGWLTALGIGGSGIAQQAFGADWKTVLAIGSVALAGVAIVGVGYLIHRRLEAKFDAVNAEAKG